MKFKETVLRGLPWILSYSVNEFWDQLEKYANVERQRAQKSKRFGTKVSAVIDEGCAVCLSIGKDQRAATHSAADHRWQPSDLKTIGSNVEGKGGQERNFQKYGVQNPDKQQRGKGKEQSQGHNRDWEQQDFPPHGRDPSGTRWTESGGKSGGKGKKGQGKFRNYDDSQGNGNPFYTESPANRTFGKGKDSRGRGKGKSNESNPNSNASNNKGQGCKRGGG